MNGNKASKNKYTSLRKQDRMIFFCIIFLPVLIISYLIVAYYNSIFFSIERLVSEKEILGVILKDDLLGSASIWLAGMWLILNAYWYSSALKLKMPANKYFSLKKNNHFKMFFVLTCVFFVICAVVIPVSYETRIVASDECIVEHKPFTDDVFYDYGDADEVYVYVNEEWVRKSSWAKRLCVEVTFDKDVIQFRQKYFGRSMINQEKFISLFDESAVVKNPENKEKIKFKSEDNKKALDRIFAE